MKAGVIFLPKLSFKSRSVNEFVPNKITYIVALEEIIMNILSGNKCVCMYAPIYAYTSVFTFHSSIKQIILTMKYSNIYKIIKEKKKDGFLEV